MSEGLMALLQEIKNSEHYFVHALDSVLVKHAVSEAVDEIDALCERVRCAELRVEELTPKIDEPLQRLGAWLADHLDDDKFNNAEQYLNAALAEAVALRARVRELEGLAGIVGELGDSAKMLMYGLREWEYMGSKITETGSWIDLADAVNWYNEAGVYAILAGGGKGEDRG